MAQSPAALEGSMSLLEALAKGLLSKKLAMPYPNVSLATNRSTC
jgi:hypothetical protein